ncbi:MAG: bacterial transcriptional activator domain-containing protein [Planctomycetia bacterium]|nr:bacterial transcriptional activator domain-containing protein [Planctomycetia bacterium]
MNSTRMVASCLIGVLAIQSANSCTLALEPETDRSASQGLRAAIELIEDKEWDQALRLLQSLLNLEKDTKAEVVRTDPTGKPMQVVVHTWTESERIIQSLPPEGLRHYETHQGLVAAELLRRVKDGKDDDLLAEIVRRFRCTKSGVEAAEQLANRLLEAGKAKDAVPYFERLVAWPGPDKLEPLTLYRAALALRRAGDKPRSEEVWKQLATQLGKEGIRIGNRTLKLDELRKELEKAAP